MWGQGMASYREHLLGCISKNSTRHIKISIPLSAPRGSVRDNGGHAVALKWSMKYAYGVEAGDVYWTATDAGWVVGHS